MSEKELELHFKKMEEEMYSLKTAIEPVTEEYYSFKAEPSIVVTYTGLFTSK